MTDLLQLRDRAIDALLRAAAANAPAPVADLAELDALPLPLALANPADEALARDLGLVRRFSAAWLAAAPASEAPWEGASWEGWAPQARALADLLYRGRHLDSVLEQIQRAERTRSNRSRLARMGQWVDGIVRGTRPSA